MEPCFRLAALARFVLALIEHIGPNSFRNTYDTNAFCFQAQFLLRRYPVKRPTREGTLVATLSATMDPLLISAASGMKARMESLDLLANNLANTGTSGFKADREFYGLYIQELPVLEKQWTDFSQGPLQPTGNPLDFGLAGSGFFALNSPGGTVYTRNGEFHVSKANQLQTSDGYTLRNARDEGKAITVDPRSR